MSTDAYYHPRSMSVDLADLPTWLYNELVSLHGHIEPPPAPPVLTCLGNRQPMYVWRHFSGRFFARHYPGGNMDKHSHSLGKMADAHLHQAEYAARAARDNGLDAALEVSTGGGTRVDVGIFGNQRVGLEIQRSNLSRVQAKGRCAKSFRAGWPTAWIHDKQNDPDWGGHVPTARLTMRQLNWEITIPPPNTAKVVIRKFWRERNKDRKSGWSYEYGPTEILLDELACLLPLGEIESVAVGKYGRVVLAHKGAGEIIDSCTYPGASSWSPVPDAPRTKEAPQEFKRPCKHNHSGSVQNKDSSNVCIICKVRCCFSCGVPLVKDSSILRGCCLNCDYLYDTDLLPFKNHNYCILCEENVRLDG